MAVKTFYATRDLKNPSYGTRMLRAGDPVELDAPKARLYLALKAVTAEKPKRAAAPKAEAETPAPVEQAKPKAKRAPRKRAAAKKSA